MPATTYTMPPIVYVILFDMLCWPRPESLAPILQMSALSHGARSMCISFIFQTVKWPLKQQADPDTGLHVFPQHIRRFIRHLRIAWPGEWADYGPGRSQWGQACVDTSMYPHPGRFWYDPEARSIENLASIIPDMASLQTAAFSCPFWPPRSLLSALSSVGPNFSSITFDETPISGIPGRDSLPDVHLPVQSLVYIAVFGSIRMGDGYLEPKYTVESYFQPEWKRKYVQVHHWDSTQTLHRNYIMSHAVSITHLEISGSLFSYDDMAFQQWPFLRSLILTGRIPSRKDYDIQRGTHSTIEGVLARMPKLDDLRLLFSQTQHQSMNLAPCASSARLTSLAVSHICSLEGVKLTSLRRLAVLAITHYPRPPIALSIVNLDKVLQALEEGDASITRFRVMVEDPLSPQTCRRIAECCPLLEDLEIELCVYPDGVTEHSKEAYAEALAPLTHLHSLRICIQFPESDAGSTSPFAMRKEYAHYFATVIPSLSNIGLEYRRRVGRAQDLWVDYEVVRLGDQVAEVEQLVTSFYPQTSIWHRQAIAA